MAEVRFRNIVGLFRLGGSPLDRHSDDGNANTFNIEGFIDPDCARAHS
jgi:hypothetical protein